MFIVRVSATMCIRVDPAFQRQIPYLQAGSFGQPIDLAPAPMTA